MATKNYSGLELQVMQLRASVLETALRSASINTIKSPMSFCEELWAWVADVGQPAEPDPEKSPRRTTKTSG
jgi:hypothetical protein